MSEPTAVAHTELDPAVARANLEAHRAALLSDHHATALHLERMSVLGSPPADIAAATERASRIAELIDRTDERIAALDTPADPPA